MSEFAEEEFLDWNGSETALPEDGPAAVDRIKAATIGRGSPTTRPAEAPRLRPASAPGEAERQLGLAPEPLEETLKSQRGRRFALLVVAPLAAAALMAAGYVYWDDAAHSQSTDDAFIAARQFAVAAKASGFVAEVPVADNQHVAAGDVIARIDDRDYRVALGQAEAQTAVARANLDNADAQIAVQKAQIDQSQAQLDSAEAGLAFAEQQATRYQDLAQRGAGTVQNAQQYSAGLRQQQASVKTAEAALTTAQRQVAALSAQRASAAAGLASANAQLDQAKLNLSYTVVTAAQPGRVARPVRCGRAVCFGRGEPRHVRPR